jgi:hypothetical protein
MDTIPFAALRGEKSADSPAGEIRAALASADVVIGVDAATQREFTVFGTPPLEESFVAGKKLAIEVVRVELDQRSGELDQLMALVRSIKGRSDYAGPTG